MMQPSQHKERTVGFDTFWRCIGLKDALLLPDLLIVALPGQQIIPPLGIFCLQGAFKDGFTLINRIKNHKDIQ